MIVIQFLARIVEFVLMVTTLTLVLVLLGLLERIVKQVITNKPDFLLQTFHARNISCITFTFVVKTS